MTLDIKKMEELSRKWKASRKGLITLMTKMENGKLFWNKES